MHLECPICRAVMATVDDVPVLQSLVRCRVFQCDDCRHVHVPGLLAPEWWTAWQSARLMRQIEDEQVEGAVA